MKGIYSSKILLFINVLCLLWLPNYCDIKQNEAAAPEGVQIHEIVSDVPSKVENLPSKQKKENVHDELDIPVKKMSVEPNVEYVNNVENSQTQHDKEELVNPESSQHSQFSEEILQQVTTNLESSRFNTIGMKEPRLKSSSEHSEKNSEITVTSAVESPVPAVKPTLSAPTIEPSVVKKPFAKTDRIMDLSSVSDAPESSETVTTGKVKGTTELPYHVPMAVESEKYILEESMHQQPHYDGMPSFDEWKKMMLAEQEKGGQKVPSPSSPGKKISSQKRRRNYSSYECGAKIVASNTESEGTGRILNELVDEYMLNPCKAKIWFVIELCETVQASQIELANFELFSSCPKEFAVYSSDNFPSRDWALLGTFTAVEQRVLQSFELKQEGFGKFIKIELQSYYGKEHYCPLSVVRIFGTSMVDEYEEMETLSSHPIILDDELDRLDISIEDKKSTNIFGSATDAVMSIVKKAAQALGQHHPLEDGDSNATIPDQQNASEAKLCTIIDRSSDKCEDVSVKRKGDNLQSIHNFSIPSSSIRQSLFRLLHRCDQCVSSRIRYYSSAQPHCRFFQAAFGPIAFQALCDWFKEHPPVFAHESSAHRNKSPAHNDALITSPTKSPPPQIMIVPFENDTLKKLLLSGNLSSLSGSSRRATVNTTQTFTGQNDSHSKISDQIWLEASVQPSRSHQPDHSTSHNMSKKESQEVSGETALPTVDTVHKFSGKSTVIIPEKSEVSLDKVVVETPPMDAGVVDLSLVSDVFTEADEEQIKEFISDSGSVAEDILSDIVSATEFSTIKPDDEQKVQDMQSETTGKLQPVPVSSVSTAGQKESVFMRMSNRIKALELNMSLSSQYLQELSQRYRRQMEEMQRAFNRTIGTLNDTARKAAEKDLKQQEILNSLQLQVANLTESVELLLNERSTIYHKMVETHLCLMVVEAIVMITVMSLYVRRISSSAGQLTRGNSMGSVVASPRLSKRRSSVDSATPPVARKVKKRSVSEEALNCGEELLIIEPLAVLPDPTSKAKKKNRKRNRVQRSNSNPIVQRRNSSPASQSTTEKPMSHSETCMLSSVRSKHQLHRKNHPCENCIEDTCTEIKAAGKEKRLNGAPLQNLTNGSVVGLQEPPAKSQRLAKGKERFSIRKFLKFQKRDSI